MIMIKIGDSIVNENAFICMKLRLDKHIEEAVYSISAYWNDGEDVSSSIVHTFSVPLSDDKLSSKKINSEFRIAYRNMEWQTYDTA